MTGLAEYLVIFLCLEVSKSSLVQSQLAKNGKLELRPYMFSARLMYNRNPGSLPSTGDTVAPI